MPRKLCKLLTPFKAIFERNNHIFERTAKYHVFFQNAEKETRHSKVIQFPFFYNQFHLSHTAHSSSAKLNNLIFDNLCKYA